MNNIKTRKKIILILVIAIIITFWTLIIRNSFSRYTSDAENNGNIDVAFYILNSSFNAQTERILISEMEPRDEAYTYIFSVSNFNENARAQVDMEYYVLMRTTTNLPLSYKIYRKIGEEWRDYSNNTRTNIKKDTDGTYLKEITVMNNENKKFQFNHKQNLTDEFKIEVNFPTSYKSEDKYADLIESMELSIIGNQILDENKVQ